MGSQTKPTILRTEPFRLFFPLAFALGVAGVTPWLLFTTGAIGTYLRGFHAVSQTQAFLPAFAAGFLLTAIPKRTGTRPASWAEIGALLVLFPVVSIATICDAEVLGQAAYAASFLVLAQFAVRRFVFSLGPSGLGRAVLSAKAPPTRAGVDLASAFLARGAARRPPPSFVLVPVGLLAGLAGAALTSAGLAEGVPVWVLSLGRRLAFEGVFLCLALGVGAFFVPLAGSGVRSRDVGAGNRLAAFAYAAAGLTVIGGLAVEVAGAPRVGALMRGAVSALVVVASGTWRLPSRPGVNRRLLWIASWAIPLGLLAAAALPDQRIEALHVTFVGGFGLLAFAVGSHVTLGHTGDEAAQSGWAWPLLISGVLFVAAMGLRATVLVMPEHFFGWLGAAAALWLLGATLWALYLLPRLGRAPEVSEGAAP